MDSEAILSELNGIFHQVFGDDSIVLTRATTAADIKDWDSFNHINIVIAVEIHFGIKFLVAEIEGLKNVGDMVDTIAKKLAAKAR